MEFDSLVQNIFMLLLQNSLRRYFVKNACLKISPNSQENTCTRASFLLKKETLAQLFSYEFCEISKNTFSYRTPPVAASASIFEYLLLKYGVNYYYKFLTNEVYCYCMKQVVKNPNKITLKFIVLPEYGSLP